MCVCVCMCVCVGEGVGGWGGSGGCHKPVFLVQRDFNYFLLSNSLM